MSLYPPAAIHWTGQRLNAGEDGNLGRRDGDERAQRLPDLSYYGSRTGWRLLARKVLLIPLSFVVVFEAQIGDARRIELTENPIQSFPIALTDMPSVQSSPC